MSKSSWKMGSRMIVALTVAAGFSSLAGPSPVTAQERTNREPLVKKTAGSDRMSYLRLAGELAHFGVETQDPVLLVAAARLEAMAGGRSVDREPASRGPAVESDGESEGAGATPPVDLYELAAALGGGNDAVRMVIAEGRSLEGGRALAAGGPKVSRGSVLAGTTDVYRVTFIGGSWAAVTLSGDGDTDLDLSVYDERGNLVCEDLGSTDDAYCEWVPRWTGVFRVHVENLGGVYNRYTLATN